MSSKSKPLSCGGASHASKGGRRWRYYVSRAALTVVRIPASEIENRVARAVGAHLAGQTNTIDGCRADHGILGGIQAVTQHGQTRRLRQDPPTEKEVRNAIERTMVSATRIEILLSESVVAEGQDRVLPPAKARALDIGALVGQLVGGGASGAIVSAIVGLIMNRMKG